VIGYFAQFGPMDVACTDGDACVIAGSRQAMEHYLVEADPRRAGGAVIRKTRFKEIRQGLELGGAYAFDERSYEQFFPLARRIGLPVEEADFEAAREREARFFTVRLVEA
jgi:hypothetical protein